LVKIRKVAGERKGNWIKWKTSRLHK
jgi:hypothetical protein